MSQRLHKVLAHCGVASRRQCEELIAQGRVEVNSEVVTKPGTRVDPDVDQIRVDGENVKLEQKVYYLLNKPKGYLCTTSDDRGRPHVVDLIREHRRIYPVGRLDEESEGLLLLTNDGSIANVVCHPRYEVDKTYQVTVRGTTTPDQLQRIERGVWLSEGKTGPAQVLRVQRRQNSSLVTITLWEGRNRELRRMFAKVGMVVSHLKRTAIGPLQLGAEIPPGVYRKLAPGELEFVRERLKAGPKKEHVPTRRRRRRRPDAPPRR